MSLPDEYVWLMKRNNTLGRTNTERSLLASMKIKGHAIREPPTSTVPNGLPEHAPLSHSQCTCIRYKLEIIADIMTG